MIRVWQRASGTPILSAERASLTAESPAAQTPSLAAAADAMVKRMLGLILLSFVHDLKATPVTEYRDPQCAHLPTAPYDCNALELGRSAKGDSVLLRKAMACVCQQDTWRDSDVKCALGKVREAITSETKQSLDFCSCNEGGNSGLLDACAYQHVMDARRDTQIFIHRAEEAMSPTEKAAFERVAAAAFKMHRAFVEYDTELREGEDEVQYQTNFVKTATAHFEHLDTASNTAAELAAADQRLNAEYQKVVKRYQDAKDDKLKELRGSQRAWIAYRDAWVQFARAYKKSGSTADDRARATALRFTKARADELEFGR